jgi:hypothetical protein
MFNSSLPPVVVGGRVSYLCYLCLFVYGGNQHILRYVFVFYFLRLVYPMLPVSLDCPFLIGSSVFSNVYQLICLFAERVVF